MAVSLAQAEAAAAASIALAASPVVPSTGPLPREVLLVPEELKRWDFNELMDFKKPARQPAECMAFWQDLLRQVLDILAHRRATLEAIDREPSCVFYGAADRKRADAVMSGRAHRRIRAENALFAQERHFEKLKAQYSRELAHAVWFNRVDAVRVRGQLVRERYHATKNAEWEAQENFEKEQVAGAMAALLAAHPHLSEATLKRLGGKLKYRLFTLRRQRRSQAPRRVLRGLPLVLCGSLPSQARLDYAPEDRALYDKCM